MSRRTNIQRWALVGLLCLGLAAGATGADHWAKIHGWFFDNFKTPELSWDLFRETFIGIAPSQAESFSFDNLFYELIYKKKLSEPGNCFGIDLLALLMQKYGGYLGFCEPPFIYPGDFISADWPTSKGPSSDELRKAIYLVHGHQINHRVVLNYLDVVAQNKQRDGNYAFSQIQSYLQKQDPCIVSITKDWAPGADGHAVIGYDTQVSGGTKKIFVYDPNRSYYEPGADGKTYYDTDKNTINIKSSTGEWEFLMAGTSGTYKGSPGSGGNIVIIPLSLAGPRDRIPQSVFADASEALTKIFIMGEGAEVAQITDAQGRRFLKPGTREIDTDPATAMRNVVPLIPFSQDSGRSPQVLFYRGNEPIEIEVRNAARGYRLDVMGSRGYVSVRASNGRGLDKVRVEDLLSETPSLSFESRSQPSGHEIELRSIVKPNEEVRIYKLENVKIAQGTPTNWRLTDGGRVLETSAERCAVNYDITLSALQREQVPAVKQQVRAEIGKQIRLYPSPSGRHQFGPIQVERSDLPSRLEQPGLRPDVKRP